MERKGKNYFSVCMSDKAASTVTILESVSVKELRVWIFTYKEVDVSRVK